MSAPNNRREVDANLKQMVHGNLCHLSGTDESSEVILSVIWQGNKLGAAYYDIDTEHLYLLSDHSETDPFTSLKLLLKQVEPHCTITSCKSDEKFQSILYEASYESSRHHLQNLNLRSIPQNMNDAERKIYFSSLMDFSNICMVKAAGGLLKFIGKKSLSSEISVLSISQFSLNNIVTIDENTYRALQIFQDERHPSVYKSAVGIKEGLSLYGICNKCKSSVGKKELKRWFLLPTNDLSVIQERQEAVKFFSLSKNAEVVSAIQGSLKHIKFLPKIFTRMKTAQASMNDWKTLYKTSYHAMVIGEMCRSHSSSLEIFKEIGEAFSTDLFRVSSLLDKVIDFEEYARQNHFAVKPGVDDEIDKMKRIYNGLPDFMTKVAHQELQELGTDIEQCSVIYLPQLGYLLAILMTENMKETKDYSLPNLKFMFVLNDTVHYKSVNTRKLDSLLGDTLCDIYDKETQIMHKLQNRILEIRQVFFAVMDLLAKLDCLISIAVASKEFSWIQPEMSMGTFVVLKARHPLQELCVGSFVANDILSGGSENRIKILTGPNSSGKSTYLNQIALVAFMAHLGSFVPAQRAQIPLLDSILTCIHSTESVSNNLSSFLMSLSQLSSCLSYSSENSLIVVDEFGKNTEAPSGLALLAASIKFWLQKEINSPHVFIATHYLALNMHIPVTPFIAFQTMDMILNEELVSFYQVVDGIAASSYASHIAHQAIMPEHIVERSDAIVNDLKQNQSISMKESKFLTQRLKRYMSIYDAFLELDVDLDHVFDFVKLVKELPK